MPAEPDGTDPIRVVVIDDHEMVVHGLTLVLERRGIEVVDWAGTVAGGVRKVISARPDVVLLDYRLPDGDAVEVIRQLAEEAPGVAVLVLTAVSDPALAADVVQAGAAGYLTKDLPAEELVRALQAASRGETVIPPDMLGAVVSRLRNPGARLGGDLTDRERQTLALMAEGIGVDEIAGRMHLSRNTVRKHVQAVLLKLGAHSQLEAVAVARRGGVLGPPG